MANPSVRINCSMCASIVDVKADKTLLDIREDEGVIFIFTCPHCNAFVERGVNKKQESLLRAAGVWTVDDMAKWIVAELEDR